MSTKEKIINGLTFTLTAPYVEGHVVNAAEAKALNQTRLENIGNNVRAKIKEMLEANAAESEIVDHVTGVDAAYVFTMSSGGGRSTLDPYEREALAMAKGLLKNHLAASGRKLTTAPEGLTQDEWDAKVEAEVERISTSTEVVAAAKKVVDAKRKSAEKLAEAVGTPNL